MNARKTTYRILATADAYHDRDKLFSHGEHTLAAKAASEERARQIAADFERDHAPKGPGAYIAVEETRQDGSWRVLLHRRGSLSGWKGSASCW